MPEEVTFFTSVLGFITAGEIELWPGIQCKKFSSPGNDAHFMIIPRHKKLNGENVIILNTENCIQTFLEIKNMGIDFISPPCKIPTGIMVEFKDNGRNHFILLEEKTPEEL